MDEYGIADRRSLNFDFVDRMDFADRIDFVDSDDFMLRGEPVRATDVRSVNGDAALGGGGGSSDRAGDSDDDDRSWLVIAGDTGLDSADMRSENGDDFGGSIVKEFELDAE